MHLPDGFINNGITGPLLGAAAAFVSFAFAKVRRAFFQEVPVLKQKLATFPNQNSAESTQRFHFQLKKNNKRLLERSALIGSFILATQMIDLPLTNGVTGHMLGGALAGLMLGPWIGTLVMAAILCTQALILGDGGILALGANILTIGIVTVWSAWGLFRLVNKRVSKSSYCTIAIVTWISVMLAALVTSIFISGTAPFDITAHELLTVHIFIGIGEGIVTAALIYFFQRNKEPIAAFSKKTRQK